MPTCAAINCSNRLRKGCGKTFHRFPRSNPSLMKEWLEMIRRDSWTPSAFSTLCSDHFEEKCFDRTGQTTRLRYGAVPTLFSFSAHALKTKGRQKRPFPPASPVNTTVRDSKHVRHPRATKDNGQSGKHKKKKSHQTSDSTSTYQLRTHIKKSFKYHDHTYCAGESTWSGKRKLDEFFDRSTKLKKHVKIAQRRSRHVRSKVHNLSEVIKALGDGNLLSENGLEMLEKTCEVPAKIMKRIVRARKSDIGSKQKYPAELRAFALTLNFYSANAYRYVRRTFTLQLPNTTVIRKWYSAIDGRPGFTAEAFTALEEKVKQVKEDEELVCALMLDEMRLKKHVEWDGNKFHGYVDIGTECSNDCIPVAKNALMFMVVALNFNWKIPVGYFLIDGMMETERANLIQQCLSKLADVGVWISSLTCNGPSCHFKMLETLGATMKMPNIQPCFPHPLNPDHNISVFLDICHMLNLMRNTLASNGILRDGNGRSIKWEYIEELQKLQEEDLQPGNKVGNVHLQWQKQKMKLNVAAQTLSRSVAEALEFLQEEGLPQFRDCQATVDFIRTIDHLFNVLNSRNPLARNLKAPLRLSNEHEWRPFLAKSFQYLSSITDAHGREMFVTRCKTPFFGFLAGIKSVQQMYDSLVVGDHPKLKYLLTNKMSQDHLELFFRAMRVSSGCNNPTAREFSSAYKKLLIRHEIQGQAGNCAPQDKMGILHVSSSHTSTDSTNSENDMLLIRRYDLPGQNPLQCDHDYTDIPNVCQLSPYKRAVISYVACFVVRMTRQSLSCDECVGALSTGEIVNGSFLEKKNRGELVRATPDVVTVCKVAEQFLQRLLNTTTGDLSQCAGVTHVMCTAVLSEVGHKDIFSSLSGHMLDCAPDHNHVFALIKCLAASYLKIRMHHLSRQFKERASGKVVRKQLSKFNFVLPPTML